MPILRSIIVVATASIMALFMRMPAFGENEVSLSVSEEYNDNVYLQPDDRITDYIFHIVPSVRHSTETPFWTWDVSYAYDFRDYARDSVDRDVTHRLDLVNRTHLNDEGLFLEVRDQYSRVSLNPAFDYTLESAFFNQSDRNILTISPYQSFRPSPLLEARAGVRYTNVWYEEKSAVDKEEFGGFLETRQELTSRMTVTYGTALSRNQNRARDYTRAELYAMQSYEYSPESTLSLMIGATLLDFERTGNTNQLVWRGGIIQHYPTVTLTFDTGLVYTDNPENALIREDSYVLGARKQTELLMVGLSLGLREYRSAETKHLQTSRYQARGFLSFTLTPKTRIAGDLLIERLEDNRMDIYTSRYLPHVRFEHEPAENLIAALDFRYANSYSPDEYQDNYYNNRLMIELRKQF